MLFGLSPERAFNDPAARLPDFPFADRWVDFDFEVELAFDALLVLIIFPIELVAADFDDFFDFLELLTSEFTSIFQAAFCFGSNHQRL